MKKILILLFCAGILLACNESDDYDPELTGKWKLAEVLADPGDGSGTFHKVSSKKTLEFYADGTITSNGSICQMSADSDSPSTGTYSLQDSTITSIECADLPMKIRFRKTGSVLLLIYPCIEGCIGKYEKQ
ncbi:MAG: lipocalin family protein [Mangrovibacterium sp.]